MIRGRGFVIGIIALTLCAAPAASQQLPKIGFVSFQGAALAGHIKYFRDGMTALGHAERKSYELESHFTGGNREATKEIIETLMKNPVDVLVVWVTPVAHMAKVATQTIPIVMLVTDALATGLVPNLSRPGGNLTGATMAGTDLAGKRLEILREIRPSIRTVAFVGVARDSNGETFARETQAAADKVGMKLLTKLVDGPSDITDGLFESLKRDGAKIVIIQPIFTGVRDKIMPLAMKVQLPLIADYPPFAEAGALFSFGVDETERLRRLAYFVDRILKGAKPADLPVELPTSFKLVVNVKTAKTLGWSIPEAFLTRADAVIE